MLIGGGGNDTIRGNNGDDSIQGGDDNDLLLGGNQNDTIEGGSGDDTIQGDAGDDSLLGGAGGDFLTGGTGNDTIDGGDPSGDVAFFSSPSTNYIITTTATPGEATVQDTVGGDGTDTITNVSILRFSDQDVVIGPNPGITDTGDVNPNTLTGTAGDDTLSGLEGNDNIDGLAGNDSLLGGDDNDTILGGLGSDILEGGAGNDSLLGEGESDTILGGDGNDTIGNGTVDGDDSIDGGAGADRIADYYGQNTVLGGDGNDDIDASGPIIDGGDGDDNIRTYRDFSGGVSAVSVTGGLGNDTIATSSYFNGTALGVTLDGGEGNDSITGTGLTDITEVLIGGGGNDTIRGNNGDDSIQGGDDNDLLLGGNQNDTIEGGSGDDTIQGNAGDDLIDGGDTGETTGDIYQNAGDRDRYALIDGSAGSIIIVDRTGTEGRDTLTGIETLDFADVDLATSGLDLGSEITGTNPAGESLTGTNFDDLITGLGGNDTIAGLDGGDIIDAGDGANDVDGGAGNDEITAGVGNDTVIAGDGDDEVNAGDGDDSIDGGIGNDSLLGEGGSDTILGGDGNDTIGNGTVDGDDSIDGGAGADRIADYYGQNTVLGGDGNDDIDASGPIIDGGDGDDNIRTYRDFSGGVSAVSVTGGLGNDTIATSSYFNGTALGVTLDGGEGNDSITGTGLTDITEVLIGGGGNDTIRGNNGDDSIQGGDDNDLLLGGNQNDTIEGGSGDDTIQGNAGDDLIDGGDTGETTGDIYQNAGDRDRYALIDGSAGSIIIVDRTGTEGRDTLTGIETLDFADVDLATSGLDLGSEITGTNPAGESLTGTNFDDLITGLGGNDTIAGLDGGDIIDAGDGANDVDGGAGNDEITAGVGNDTVIAGDGDDEVNAGDGDDSIDGGIGNDSLLGEGGSDTILGGDGNDTIGNGTVDGDDSIDGGAGADRIADYYGQNTVLGGDGNDDIDASGPIIDGGDGDDNIRTYRDFSGGVSAVSVTGGLGNDTIATSSYFNGTALGVTLDGGEGNDSITGTGLTDITEVLIGGGGNDTIRGNNGDDSIQGGDDNDSLFGGNQNDTIEGGSGDDILEGEAGNDTIDGGTEATADGDIAVFNGPRGNYSIIGDSTGLTVVDNVGSDGTDVVTNVERLRFTDGDVIVATGLVGASIVGTEFDDNGQPGNPGALIGTILNDTIEGRAGDDSIVGLAGIDIIDGEGGDDTIDAGSEDDIVAGGTGNDCVIGGEGDDQIDLGDGIDIAVFAGDRADYSIVGDSVSATVTDLDPVADGDDGTDSIGGARILRFADQDVFLNNAPVTDSEAFTTNEDTQLVIPIVDLLNGDTDADGDTITVARVANASNGTVFVIGSNVIFNPTANFNGAASFEYVAFDGFEETNQSVSITVDPVNDVPVLTADSATTDEDTPVVIDVLANDSDVDGDTLTVTAVGASVLGAPVINADNTITFTPNADVNGTASFSYTVDDGSGDLRSSSVTVSINPVNDAPVGADDSFTTGFETVLNVPASGVLANDTDVEGDALTAVLDTGPTDGVVAFNGDGSFDYTPNAGFSGTDSFTYFANDGSTDALAPSTVTITVNAATNTAPTANNDSFSTDEDVALSGDVLANDTDAEDDTLTVSLLSGVTDGTLVLNGDGTFDYTPDADFNGTDSFRYEITDGEFTSDATVSITVDPVNDVPVLTADSATTDEDTPVVIDVLANDSDVDGDTLTVTAVGASVLGAPVINADNTITFTPNADVNGTASFSYTVDDGSGDLRSSSVTVSINPVNDAPVGADDSFTTGFETVLNVPASGVLANDTDVEGDALTAVLDTGPTDGVVAFNGDGSFDYTPNAGFSGTDSFTYFANDGSTDALAPSTVTITVNAATNTAPTANNDSFSTDEDVALSGDVLANDTDAEDDTLTVSLLSGVTDGTLVLNGDGTFDYTPDADFNGTDSFRYEITDGEFTSDATVSITVDPVNDVPVLTADSATTDEDTPVVIDVLANDSDVDGDTLTVTAVGASVLGAPVINADNTITFTPNADVNGTASFSYTVDDGSGDLRSSSVTVSINPVNDAPVGADDSFTTGFETVLNVPASGVLANDTDVEGDALTAVLDTGPTDGVVAFNGDGSFDYTPNAGFSGTDSFTYFANDGSTDALAPSTVTITVTSEDDPGLTPVLGTDGNDLLVGSDADERFVSFGGSIDRMTGGGGADEFVFGAELDNNLRERDIIYDYGVEDTIFLASDNYTLSAIRNGVLIRHGDDGDLIYVLGSGIDETSLTIEIDAVGIA